MRVRWMVIVVGLGACPAGDPPETGTTGTTGTTGAPGTSGSVTTSGASTGGGETATPTSEPVSTGSTAIEVTTSTSAASSSTTGDDPVLTSTGESTSSSDATTGSSSTGAPPLLRVEPPMVTLEVKSGWSFPQQFTAVLDDGLDTPVSAAWTLDAPLGRITRYGGTFTANNTAGGVVQISAEYDGQVATADVEVVLVDDVPVCPPRPPLTAGTPEPGKYIKVVAPEYAGTGVYHGVYLPPDWTPGRRYPVIVESPCNSYQSFTGKVEDTRLGYYWSGCRHYIWIVLPYIQAQANLDYGWGELAANLEYWQTNVQRTLEDYGGDPGAVVVTGFSRGAIGTSWIGLQDPTIADIWLGFFMHSHADVVTNLTPDNGAGSSTRMQRVGGRASLLSWGAAGDGGMINSTKGVDLLTSFGYPVTQLAVPNVGHTDAWILDDPTSHATAQSWLFENVAARTGTAAVYGRVTDALGEPVAGARVESGRHFDVTDAHGYYGLRGLVPGMRTVTCLHPGCSSPQMIDVGPDVEDVDFMAP